MIRFLMQKEVYDILIASELLLPLPTLRWPFRDAMSCQTDPNEERQAQPIFGVLKILLLMLLLLPPRSLFFMLFHVLSMKMMFTILYTNPFSILMPRPCWDLVRN